MTHRPEARRQQRWALDGSPTYGSEIIVIPCTYIVMQTYRKGMVLDQMKIVSHIAHIGIGEIVIWRGPES